MISKKPWFVYWNPPYKGKEPDFFEDINEVPAAAIILENYQIIQKEVSQIINERNGTLIAHPLDKMYDQGGWETLSFINWDIPIPINKKKAPTISRIIDENPTIVSISINILKKGKVIKEHCGDTNAIVRCHLGIDIPAQLPDCGFQVNETQKSWQNGKLLLFCDAYNHKAWNKSNKDRVIISFDIIRNKFFHQKKKITLKVRAFLILQLLIHKVPGLKKLPKTIHKLIQHMLIFILYTIYPFQKKYGTILKHS